LITATVVSTPCTWFLPLPKQEKVMPLENRFLDSFEIVFSILQPEKMTLPRGLAALQPWFTKGLKKPHGAQWQRKFRNGTMHQLPVAVIRASTISCLWAEVP
jgi:hypothetical protein